MTSPAPDIEAVVLRAVRDTVQRFRYRTPIRTAAMGANGAALFSVFTDAPVLAAACHPGAIARCGIGGADATSKSGSVFEGSADIAPGSARGCATLRQSCAVLSKVITFLRFKVCKTRCAMSEVTGAVTTASKAATNPARLGLR